MFALKDSRLIRLVANARLLYQALALIAMVRDNWSWHNSPLGQVIGLIPDYVPRRRLTECLYFCGFAGIYEHKNTVRLLEN